MQSTPLPAADRRVARRRVGAAAILAFLVLLLAGAARSTAGTDPALPSATPAEQATPVPPQQTAPSQPQQTAPGQPEQTSPSGHRPCPGHGGAGGGDGGRGFRGGGGPRGGGGGPAPPAPP